MKLRTEPHKPAFGALAFEMGDRTIHLLAGDPFKAGTAIKDLTAKLSLLYAERGEAQPHLSANAAIAVYLFNLWDDSEIGWTVDADPDEVLNLEGSELLDVAERLRSDFWSPSTRRLGLAVDSLAEAMAFALKGMDGKQAAMVKALVAKAQAAAAEDGDSDAGEA